MKQAWKYVKKAIDLISNPKSEFEKRNTETLEKAVADFMYFVLIAGAFAAVFNFLFAFVKAAYLNVFLTVTIDYMRLANYAFGRSMGIFFFYLFASTFLLSIIGIIVKLFVRKMKFKDMIKIMLYSVSPLLLFGWLPISLFAFVAWSIFLFFLGLKAHKQEHISKKSIAHRN